MEIPPHLKSTENHRGMVGTPPGGTGAQEWGVGTVVFIRGGFTASDAFTSIAGKGKITTSHEVKLPTSKVHLCMLRNF